MNQARQAYLSGNKALAKELSAKGQWHNEQMKAAHSKAGEAIFWQRYCKSLRSCVSRCIQKEASCTIYPERAKRLPAIFQILEIQESAEVSASAKCYLEVLFSPSSRQNVSVEQIPNVSAFVDFLSAGMQMFMGIVAVQQGKHDY